MHLWNVILSGLALGSPFCAAAQAKGTAPVRTSYVYQHGKLIGLTQYDPQGNALLNVNDGLNGPVTMAFASEFDSLGRQTRMVFAHSNVGCSVYDYAYANNEKRTFTYKDADPPLEEGPRGDESRKILAELRSVEQLNALPELQNALKGERYLSRIEHLDPAGRTLKEICLNMEGDTTCAHTHAYNADGKETYFRYGGGSDGWAWEYFATFDSNGHKVRWARVEGRGGERDTTELDTYRYDGAGNQVEHLRYLQGELRYTEHYTYDTRGRLVETRAVNTPEPNKVWLTKYSRQKDGTVRRERRYEVINGHSKVDHDYKFKSLYW